MQRRGLYILMFFILITLLISFAPGSAGVKAADTAKNPADGSYKPAAGTYSVGTADGVVLKDAKRANRPVAIKIYYPKTTGVFPVIILSPMEGGSKDWYAYLGEYWASHGYISIHLTHQGFDSSALKAMGNANPNRGGNNDNRGSNGQGSNGNWGGNGGNGDRQGRPGGAGMRQNSLNPDKWVDRAKDVSFVIDSFAEIEKQASALKGKFDKNHIGVAGHSLGAQTVLALAGALLDTPKVKDVNLSDTRIKAFLVMSLQAPMRMGFDEKSAAKLTRPVMVMEAGGKKQPAPKGNNLPKQEKLFDLLPKGDKYSLALSTANHYDFVDKDDFKRAEPTSQPYITMLSTAFFDGYLKDAALAKTYLKSDNIKSYSKNKVTLLRK